MEGARFYPLDPHPDDIHLSDIIHALSNTCRYGGHTNRFYSVAEHCVLLARWVREKGHTPELAMAALMHDAAEAYLGDVPRPIKGMLPDYCEIEKNVERVIFDKFGIEEADLARIKEWDRRMLIDEMLVLFDRPHPQVVEGEPMGVTIWGWEPSVATGRFITTYIEIQTQIMKNRKL